MSRFAPLLACLLAATPALAQWQRLDIPGDDSEAFQVAANDGALLVNDVSSPGTFTGFLSRSTDNGDSWDGSPVDPRPESPSGPRENFGLYSLPSLFWTFIQRSGQPSVPTLTISRDDGRTWTHPALTPQDGFEPRYFAGVRGGITEFVLGGETAFAFVATANDLSDPGARDTPLVFYTTDDFATLRTWTTLPGEAYQVVGVGDELYAWAYPRPGAVDEGALYVTADPAGEPSLAPQPPVQLPGPMELFATDGTLAVRSGFAERNTDVLRDGAWVTTQDGSGHIPTTWLLSSVAHPNLLNGPAAPYFYPELSTDADSFEEVPLGGLPVRTNGADGTCANAVRSGSAAITSEYAFIYSFGYTTDDSCPSSTEALHRLPLNTVVRNEGGPDNERTPLALSVAPNPVGDRLRVVVQESGRLELLDALGRTVLAQPVRVGQAVLDVSDLPAGAYALRLTTDTASGTRRVTVVR